jgi:hypothetical protein
MNLRTSFQNLSALPAKKCKGRPPPIRKFFVTALHIGTINVRWALVGNLDEHPPQKYPKPLPGAFHRHHPREFGLPGFNLSKKSGLFLLLPQLFFQKIPLLALVRSTVVSLGLPRLLVSRTSTRTSDFKPISVERARNRLFSDQCRKNH